MLRKGVITFLTCAKEGLATTNPTLYRNDATECAIGLFRIGNHSAVVVVIMIMTRPQTVSKFLVVMND